MTTATGPATNTLHDGGSAGLGDGRGPLARRWWTDLSIRTKGLVVVALPLSALVVAVLSYAGLQQQRDHARVEVDGTLAVKSELSAILIDLLNAETGARGFLLTRDDTFLEPYRSARVEISEDMDRLARAERGGDHSAQVERLRELVNRRLDISSRLVEASTSAASPAEVDALLRSGREAMDDVRAHLAEMDATEDRLLADAVARKDQANRDLNVAMLAASLFGLAGGTTAALLFSRGVTQRIRRVEHNARNLYDGAPMQPVWGRDEVGRLGTTLDGVAALLAERERELRRSEAFLHSVIENIPNGVFAKDAAELRYVLLNRAVEDTTGISREEMLGRRDVDLFDAEHAEFYTAKDRETLATGLPVDIPEERVQTRAGDVRTMHVQKVPVFDEEGRPAFLLGISEDVTAAKQAEKELRQAKEEGRPRQPRQERVPVDDEPRDPHTAERCDRDDGLAPRDRPRRRPT